MGITEKYHNHRTPLKSPKACFMMPDSNSRDEFSYLPITPMMRITVWHQEACLVMPDSDPRDGIFYLTLTPKTDSYILSVDVPVHSLFLE